MEDKVIEKIVEGMFDTEYLFSNKPDEKLRKHLNLSKHDFYNMSFEKLRKKAYNIYNRDLDFKKYGKF